MNDIEILEEFCRWDILYGKLALTQGQLKKYQTSIENLIQRNKELEEYIIKYHDDIEKEFKGLINHKFIDYIPKSKVKEKIEELNNNYLVIAKAGDEIHAIQHNHDVDIKIQVLQELLQEGDK